MAWRLEDEGMEVTGNQITREPNLW